jgi:hypothetical protein
MNKAVDAEERADDVHAQIEFLRPTEDRAFSYGYEPAVHEPRPTAVFEPHPVVIHNARKGPLRLSLNQHGATFVEHRSSVRDFYDDTQLIEVYYAEAGALIKSITGADRVVVFDHNVRRGFSIPLRPDRYAQGRPVLHAHTDYTEVSAVRRLNDLLGTEKAALSRGRFLQVNLWRPISGPLRDAPLAICDASSIAPHHLAPVDLLYPDRRGEIYYLTYDPRQRWYYAPDMQRDEVWLLKNYDSATAGTARFAAHSAFDDPTPVSHVPARESIEVRAFAIFGA